MQEVHDDGCNAIVEWFMKSTPEVCLVEAMGGALHSHQAQLRPAKMYLREWKAQSHAGVETPKVRFQMPVPNFRFR
jgi:hypothetical protein